MKQPLLTTTELDSNIEAYLESVQVRADKIVDKFIIGFFLLGLSFAPIYDTWDFSLITGGLTVILYLLSRFAIKQKFYSRMIVSVVFAIFVLQFIGQMHGMAEIHFFFFTNIGILVIYQDWRIMAPYTILTVAHHGLLAFFQWYLKIDELGQYFITYTDITLMQLGFHFGIVALMGVICGLSAYFFRKNSIIAYQAQKLVEQQNEELQVTQENLQNTLAEIKGQFNAIDATAGYVELSPDRKIIKANEIFCKIIGYEIDEIANTPHTKLIAKNYAESAEYEQFWKELLQGKIQTREFERISKNGQSVWIYATYSPMVDSNGKVVKIVKLANDITKQKKQQEEIQKANQDLAANQEALRENIEKLQATQENLLKVQAEEQKSNEVFKALFEFSSNAHLIFDETGIMECNQATINLLGYESKEAILKLHPAKLSPEIQPDGRTSAEKSVEMDKLAKEKGYHRFEWIHQKADGTDFPAEVTLTPIKLADKEVLLVVWHDLTEIKQKEYLLQLNNAELEGQFKAIDVSMAYIEFTTERKVFKANQLACELLGYEHHEIITMPHHLFVPENYRESADYEEFWQRILQGQSFTQEFERVGKKGNIVWMHASYSPVIDNEGHIVKIVKLAVDITEDKKLAEEVQMLSMVASRTSNPVVITDAQGLITWTNESFTRISGYELTEVKGIKPGAFLQGKDTNPEDKAKIREGLNSKQSFTQEILNYHKNGTPYWLEINITPIFDENGEIKQFFGIETDITERKEAQLLIQQKNEELASSEEELRQNYEELHLTQEQLKTQFDILAVKNKNIADSINYAKRIQDALLPRLAEIQNVFPESFVFFKPRDIISGDFYWFANKGDEQIIVAADCTGHGVPGAFMSMLGSSLLNQIVHDKEIHEPNLILDLLHSGVEDMLNQKQVDSESRDGMDAAICLVNQKEKIIQFAGANNPMYVITKQALNFTTALENDTIKVTEKGEYQLTEIKADKRPIGGRVLKQGNQNYTSKSFEINQELHIYLFSDGIIDQIGGEKRMKLMSKGFKQLLLDSHEKPVNEQNQFFDTFFTNWISGTQKQLDDVLVIGFKVKA